VAQAQSPDIQQSVELLLKAVIAIGVSPLIGGIWAVAAINQSRLIFSQTA